MKKLKVCFVLDCTSSMEPWIEAAKNKILDTLEDVQKSHSNYEIYASFIGYRDFQEKIYKVDFTKNYKLIYDLVKNIKASGGGDQAEDVSGAYNLLTALNWDADINTVFHIADAPDHGNKYHDHTVSDDYPNGNPIIDLLEEVDDLAKLSVDLTVFKLNKSTNIMYAWMKKVYECVNLGTFRIIEFDSLNQTAEDSFYSVVTTQLNSSMTL